MDFYIINEKYLNYLRQFDNNISYTKNFNKIRPFIGIVLTDNNDNGYYIPITSKIKKFNKIVSEPINNGKNGYILFNNMLPVNKSNIEKLDLKIYKSDTKKEISLKLMRKYELKDINKKQNKIIKKAFKLLYLYDKWDEKNKLKNICCNFPLLEEKCCEYSNLDITSLRKEIINKYKIFNKNTTNLFKDKNDTIIRA